MHCFFVQVAVHKGDAQRVFSLHTPYKQVVKSLRYDRPGYSTRVFLKSPALREAVFHEVAKVAIRILILSIIHLSFRSCERNLVF